MCRWRRVAGAPRRRSRHSRSPGHVISPVNIAGRKIARTFWGESWCRNLEAYSDYANRLPRGRTYVRNGSVIDLQIEYGRVRALVSGSALYDVEIEIRRLARKRWGGIKSECAGKIDSIVELLRGSISRGVMEVVTRTGEGLFPAPQDISLHCSCPDWATMCKHVAAVLYGVGARLDHDPEMLFTLRGVEPAELIAAAVTDAPTTRKSGRRRLLKTDDMSSVFGIDLDLGAASKGKKAPRRPRRTKKSSTRRATKTSAPAARGKPASRAKPATKKPIARTKETKKSASVTSTGRKKPSSKSTQTAVPATAAEKPGTGRLRAMKKAVRKTAAKRLRKTPS